jgi:two-component system OmpR family response regulator
MRILLAEDDAILADGLTRSLRRAGHAVDWVKNGVEADSAVTTGEFDLLILDLGLPKMNGLEALERLRGRGSRVPVLILTALDGVRERVRALDLGADDYLTKPYAFEELEARVRALTRRSYGGTSAILRHAQLSYDQAGKVAQINGVTLDLSAREVALLEMLLQRAGRVVNKAQLVDHLCEWGEEVSANAIEVYVHRLRRKLEAGGVKIVTVRGLGYCMEKAASNSPMQPLAR